MSTGFRTDAKHSFLKPAGPHLIERSSDAPAQTLSRAEVTVRKPYKAVAPVVTPTVVPSRNTQAK